MIENNVDLSPFNTFGIKANAKHFGRFTMEEELVELLDFASQNKLKTMILGGGSNLLFTSDYNGLVLRNEIQGMEVVQETENDVTIKVGAGIVWHDFVIHCIKNNWCGIENLSLIPGNVGASPMQNIGAYGVEIKDYFVELDALNIETKKVETFTNADCKFGYRESIFKNTHKNKYVILHVLYRLMKNSKLNTSYGAINDELANRGIGFPTIKDVSEAVIAIRQSKLPDPKVLGNAGSFFKNPVIDSEFADKLKSIHAKIPCYPVPSDPNLTKVAAGWLIEQCEFKGKRVGSVGVHDKQALVLVNHGGGKGKEVYDLSTSIIEAVHSKFGITLEREVNIL